MLKRVIVHPRQVFLDQYPAARRELDFDALELKQFLPGALVRTELGLLSVSDPLRRPQEIINGILAPLGSLSDKVKVRCASFTITKQHLHAALCLNCVSSLLATASSAFTPFGPPGGLPSRSFRGLK